MRISDIINQYHLIDARNLNDLLPNREFLNVTITSPPYWDLKDYGFKRQIGFGQAYDNYLSDIQKVFKIVYERTKKDGSLWIISDTVKHDGELRLLPFDISAKLKQVGWILQDIIIWQKDRTLPWSHQGKLRNIFEYISFYSKSKKFKYRISRVRDMSDIKDYWVRYPERYSPEGKTPSRYWEYPIPRQGSWGIKNNYVKHACPLPPNLIERIINLTSDNNDIIFDPFAGSGSVLATAKAMQRRFIGVDLNKDYSDMFKKSVLPSVLEQFKTRNGDFKSYDKLRKKFGEFINSLRRLKYSKEIIRLYRHSNNLDSCLGVLVFHPGKNKKQRLIFIFSRQIGIPNGFIERVKKLSSTPPLSKYGFNPEFTTIIAKNILKSNIALKNLNKSKTLYVYRNGQFYKWCEKTNLNSLYSNANNGYFSSYHGDSYPPIFSTVKVEIDPRHPELALEENNGKS